MAYSSLATRTAKTSFAGGFSAVTTRVNQACCASSLAIPRLCAAARTGQSVIPSSHKGLATSCSGKSESRHRVEIDDGSLRTLLVVPRLHLTSRPKHSVTTWGRSTVLLSSTFMKGGSRRKFRGKIRSAAWLFAVLVEI